MQVDILVGMQSACKQVRKSKSEGENWKIRSLWPALLDSHLLLIVEKKTTWRLTTHLEIVFFRFPSHKNIE